jgi:hypothetical protein
MKYILIILYVFGSNPAMTTAEFNTEEACLEAAGKALETSVYIRVFCTPKGGVGW